jgi:cell division initiation protein
MLTPQEVSSHAFPKAVMGGYNMSAVDEFLDELTDDYTALYKENTALKAKLKVLVEKVEDYRATEDSMRATLLTAQKMADSIVKEAEAKRDQLLSQAEAAARSKIGELQSEVYAVQERKKAGQQQLAEFITTVRAACAKQMDDLDQLPQLAVEAPASEEPKASVSEIEQSVFASFDAPPPADSPAEETAAGAEEPAPAEEQPAEEPKEEPKAKAEYPKGNPFRGSGGASEPRMNLNDLKFGRNYASPSDEDDG